MTSTLALKPIYELIGTTGSSSTSVHRAIWSKDLKIP